LLTNVDKWQISPIHCTDEEIELVRQVFLCQPSPLPCRYLGVPLSVGRLHRSDEQRLIDAMVARLPTWKAHLLNTTGCFTLTQSTLLAIPVHISIAYCLSAWAVNQIDKAR
jgi:hypothetical protein